MKDQSWACARRVKDKRQWIGERSDSPDARLGDSAPRTGRCDGLARRWQATDHGWWRRGNEKRPESIGPPPWRRPAR